MSQRMRLVRHACSRIELERRARTCCPRALPSLTHPSIASSTLCSPSPLPAICRVLLSAHVQGQHRFPFQYQLPDGLPGSFLERQPMPDLRPDAQFEDDDMWADNFYDSDDDTDGVRRGPQGYRRAGLLAMVAHNTIRSAPLAAAACFCFAFAFAVAFDCEQSRALTLVLLFWRC